MVGIVVLCLCLLLFFKHTIRCSISLRLKCYWPPLFAQGIDLNHWNTVASQINGGFSLSFIVYTRNYSGRKTNSQSIAALISNTFARMNTRANISFTLKPPHHTQDVSLKLWIAYIYKYTTAMLDDDEVSCQIIAEIHATLSFILTFVMFLFRFISLSLSRPQLLPLLFSLSYRILQFFCLVRFCIRFTANSF